MRKILSLVVVMMCFFAQGLRAEALLTPDPSKTYMIQHSSGLFMTVDGNSLKIMQAGSGTSQKFTFVPVEGADEPTWNIKCEDGRYIASDKGYTQVFLSDPADTFTHYTFWESHEADHVKLWNVGRSAYVGTDANSDGSGIFSDKSGNDGKHAWKFVEATDGLLTSGLESTIATAEATLSDLKGSDSFTSDAESVLTAAIAAANGVLSGATEQSQIKEAASTLSAFVAAVKTFNGTLAGAISLRAGASVGDSTGDYPQEAADAFDAAIAAAKAAWAGATAATLAEANTALNAAVTAFNSARIVFNAEAGKKYYIINTYSNLMMAVSAKNEAVLDTPTAADNQKWEIVPVEGSSVAFNLKLSDGNYLARKGDWNTTVVTDPSENVAKFEFEIIDLVNKVYGLKKFNESGWVYMAADNQSAGQTIYTNKPMTNVSQWQIKEVVDGELLTMGFDAAVAAAEDYIAKAVVGEEAGNYPQEALDAIKAALAAAKANTATTQEQLNEVVATLQAAINDFIAAKIDPFFTPRENTAYRFSVRKYSGKFMTNNDGSAKSTSEFAAGNAGQHWTFQPVEGAKHTFIVKNDGKVLDYDGNVTEMADADAPKWTVVYCTTAGNLDYFALVQYDDPTKVVTFSSGNNFVIQSLNKGNDVHQARFLRVDPAHDPNIYNLEVAIANARYTLDNIDRGNEIGQYSDAKCEAFAAVIAAAEALAGATQEEVDAKAAELNRARTDFVNNPNSVIKDELDAAIAAAKAKAGAAEVGVAVGQYLMSAIQEFEAKIAGFEADAKQVSDQEACDALTEEVKAATEAFAGHAEAQPAATVLADAITCCEALYEAEKDNVGTDMGQRPQEAVDGFAAAIAAAKAVANPDVTDLDALLDAREAFLAGAVSVDRTPLRKAIAAAQADEFADLKGGDFDGYYPQDKIDAFNAALAAATAAEADMTKTQDEVNACTKALNDAMTDLRKSVVSVKFANLDRELAAAEAALAGVTAVGDGEGKCPQSVFDAFKAVITEAKAIDRAAINQAGVDAMVAKLGEAIVTFNTAVVAGTGINDVIAAATALLDGAEQGFKPGNYPASAIEGLRSAIAAAQATVGAEGTTQADLLAAVAALKAAMEDFKTQAVPAHDLTDIKAAIAEAEKFIAETGMDDFLLSMALDEAREVVANSDQYTKSEVKKAQENLEKALDFARQTAGIAAVGADSLSVRVEGGRIIVDGIAGKAIVAVYTVDGRMVLRAEAAAACELSLSAGKYIVAVSAEGVSMTRVVIVK